jgi:hypothetical protein
MLTERGRVWVPEVARRRGRVHASLYTRFSGHLPAHSQLNPQDHLCPTFRLANGTRRLPQ